MRAVIQRVSRARVLIKGREHSAIGKGILVLLGLEQNDSSAEVRLMAKKTIALRIFEDTKGKMNRSVIDEHGEILVVSQFTLLGDCRKGLRPSFDKAAHLDEARNLYEKYINEISKSGVNVSTGVFQAMMEIELTNDGPVTLLLDSRRTF